MELKFNAEHDRFRNEIRAFFEAALTDELRAARRFMTSVYCDHDTGMKWQRILLDKGWLVPSWPIEYGGTNWTMTQRYIFNCERARANPPPVSPMGLAMLGPGTDRLRHESAARLLPAEDAEGRRFLVSGLFRTASRIGPRRPEDVRRRRRRRLCRQRHENLDDARALREPDVLPGSHRAVRTSRRWVSRSCCST